MQNISAIWLYPIILVAGALQAWGPPMNGALRNALTNPWLASLVSFLPVVAYLACLMLCLPRPLPTAEGISAMSVVGAARRPCRRDRRRRRPAVRQQGGRRRARRADDHRQYSDVAHHRQIRLVRDGGASAKPGRIAGGALMVGGIALISMF